MYSQHRYRGSYNPLIPQAEATYQKMSFLSEMLIKLSPTSEHDAHGYTEAIFAGLHFLDVSFAPRIKNIHDQTIYAYEAKSTRKNTNAPIAPKTQINKKLILENWDEILRLMVSIKLEYCSPSQIFIMLSMSEKQSQLYKAIKELGRLIKSNFVLNYVNDEELRTSIQKQLNRVELGQKLTDAVFFGRKGKLRVGLEEEIQKAMSCNTLLRNVVIMWNYMFLSDYYYSLDDDETRKDVLDSISNGSVVSWEHINTLGVYEFNHNAGRQFKATLQQMKNIKISGI